jgi:hypothetical protein
MNGTSDAEVACAFGRVLRTVRLGVGLTQEMLAFRAGDKGVAVPNVEHNDSPSHHVGAAACGDGTQGAATNGG